MSIDLLFTEIVKDYLKKVEETRNAVSDMLISIKEEHIEEKRELFYENDSFLRDMMFVIGFKARSSKFSHSILIQTIRRKKVLANDIVFSLENFSTERPNLYPDSMTEIQIVFTEIDNLNKTIFVIGFPYNTESNSIGEPVTISPNETFGMLDMCINCFFEGFIQAKSKRL